MTSTQLTNPCTKEEENYASKISLEAKYIKSVNSEVMRTLKKIIKTISIVVVPLGILLFLKQDSSLNS